MNRDGIGPALGKVASGLYVATALLDDRPIGMVCSFVEQAGFEPPMISIAVGHGRPLADAFERHGLFGLHILSKENNPLLKTFVRGSTPESFAAHRLIENPFHIPQFSEAFAFLACKVAAHARSGDHTIYIAEVLDGTLQHPTQDPMIRIRSNGFGY